MFELCNLTAGYGTTTVLRDVSLVVPAGSVVALLGANGAGKTTLLRAASGLIPARGRITLDGRDLSGHSPHDFARAGSLDDAMGRRLAGCAGPGPWLRHHCPLRDRRRWSLSYPARRVAVRGTTRRRRSRRRPRSRGGRGGRAPAPRRQGPRSGGRARVTPGFEHRGRGGEGRGRQAAWWARSRAWPRADRPILVSCRVAAYCASAWRGANA